MIYTTVPSRTHEGKLCHSIKSEDDCFSLFMVEGSGDVLVTISHFHNEDRITVNLEEFKKMMEKAEEIYKVAHKHKYSFANSHAPVEGCRIFYCTVDGCNHSEELSTSDQVRIIENNLNK